MLWADMRKRGGANMVSTRGRGQWRFLTAGLTALAIAVFGMTLQAAPAQALQATVPANTAPSWQTNGRVNAIAYANGVVYIGGDFTAVRPPGSAPGQNEVGRSRLAAFNSSTGALITSFNKNVNASVQSLTASPDGSTLYVGGDFSAIDGVARSRVAAFSTVSGALTSFAPTLNGRVRGIAVSGSAVYLGGSFSRVGTTVRNRIASVTLAGALRNDFVPTVDNVIYKLALSKNGDTLYLAGAFSQTNGDSTHHNGAALNTSNGELRAFPAISVVPVASPGCIAELKDVTTDDDTVYFASEGTGGGCFDGTFAANSTTGELKWVSQCLGATQNITKVGSMIYIGSHAHDCTSDMGFDPDAFPEVGWARGVSRHLTARDAETGRLAAWYPNTDGGPGGGLGPRVSATDGVQLFLGGEFTTVNGQPQQGFARFSPSTGDLAVPAAPARPVAVARADGKVSVYVQAPVDLDDNDLIIRLFRDGGTTPIATAPAYSLFWRQPIVAFEDNGLAVGTNHTYTADAVEANGGGTGPRSTASSSIRVVASVTPYAAAVTADSPSFFWRLNEGARPVAADSSGGLAGGFYQGTQTFAQPGAIQGDTDRSVAFNGSNGQVAASGIVSGPNTYSVEAWINTTTTSGGKIIGFGNRQGGLDFSGNPALSTNYDRHVYMTNDGRIVFGTYNGGTHTVTTATPFNDGQWHHIVATQGPSGMALYVDGVRRGVNPWNAPQTYNGYWRVGGDNIGGWPDQPASNFFTGRIDDVSVYPTVLDKTRIQAHYVAAGYPAPPTTRPTDAYGQAVYDDSPTAYWRLDETTGTVAADASDNDTTGGYAGGVTQGAASAIPSGTGAAFDGSSGNVASTNALDGPSVFSTEVWFQTTTTRGGKLIGFGNAQTGSSSAYDKHLYLGDDGRLNFGVYNGGFDLLTTTAALNDDQWHQAVGTQDGSGMKLYVDGQLVAQNGVTTNQGYGGYWRVGGDNLNAWPNRPSSDNFAGNLDEVAIYGSALSEAQVSAHYTASGRSGPDVVTPQVSITSPADGATVTTGAVTISADATDLVGVTSVEFLVDGAVVGTSTTAPYSASWTATEGTHSITARASDAAGNIGTSAAVSVTALAPDTTAPTAAITAPTAGAQVYGPTTVTVTANDDRGVSSVELFVDGTSIGQSSTAPYTFTWDATTEGARTLAAVATDAAGNQGHSATVAVTVPADTTAPSAPSGLTAGAPSMTAVSLSWTAATDDRAVVGYRLVRDGAVLPGLVTGTSVDDTGLSGDTTYVYTVRAVDAAGNVGADSNQVTVHTAAANPVLFTDSWTQANGSGWGSAWTTESSAGSMITAEGGAGQVALNATGNAFARAQLTGLAARADTDVLLSYDWGTGAATTYAQYYLRGTGGWQNAYRPRNGIGVELASNSRVVSIRKNVNNTTTTIRNISAAQSATAGKQWLRLRVSGETISFRIWSDGQPEPTLWTATETDASVVGDGQFFVSAVRGGSTSGTRTVLVDDLTLQGP